VRISADQLISYRSERHGVWTICRSRRDKFSVPLILISVVIFWLAWRKADFLAASGAEIVTALVIVPTYNERTNLPCSLPASGPRRRPRHGGRRSISDGTGESPTNWRVNIPAALPSCIAPANADSVLHHRRDRWRF
jgi:hypothetical protein